MLERLKSTVRHTLVYSLSNIATKAVGVLLIPLFTAKLSLGEFGIWDLLDVTITILAEVFILGQASSIIFLNNSDEYKNQKGTSLFTVATLVLAVSALLVVLVESVVSLFPRAFTNSLITPGYIRLGAYIVLLRVMNNLFLSKIRADEQSSYFTIVSIARILLMTVLTIYLIAKLNKGIGGILYAAATAEFVIILFLLVKVIPQMTVKFDVKILSAALKFGFPLVFMSLGFMMLNLSDRFVIKYLLGAKWLGVYGLGYRVAGVLNMFMILPFNLSLMPIAYKFYRQPDDKRYFSKLMSYSTFFFVWGFVFLSLFSPELIKIFAQKNEFETAHLIVPVVLLSYVFSGMRLNASLGMFLTKNTKHIAWITIGSAALNIALNFIFIPIFGIMAAAANTLIAFTIFYFVTQILSDKYYKIPFENRKLLTLILVGSVISAVVYFLPSHGSFFTTLIKLILTAAFPFLLYLFRFYEGAELDILLSPKKITDFIKGTIKVNDKEPTDSEMMIP